LVFDACSFTTIGSSGLLLQVGDLVEFMKENKEFRGLFLAEVL
jgi:hypothetical protein